MNLTKLAPETEAWLKAQVENGQFPNYEAAIDYSVGLTRLRQTLLAAIADPTRLTPEQVTTNLNEHFASRRLARGD